MILSSILNSILSALIDHTLLTRKKSKMYCFIIFILTTLLTLTIGLLARKYIHNLILLKYVYYFAASISLLYIYLIFNESLLKKIFTMFSSYMFSAISLFLATLFADIFSGMLEKNDIQNLIYIIRICLQLLLLLLLYFGLNKPYKKVLGVVSDKTITFISLYPITAFLLLINYYGTSIGNFKEYSSIYDIILIVVFITIGYILVFVGIISASKIISLQYNYKILENQVELQRQNYKTLNQSLEQLYAVKHDVRHHFSAIRSLLDEKKYSKALEYLLQFNQNEIVKGLPTLCRNFTADSIIKYYMSISLNKAIEFIPNLDIPEDININSLDLCIVLGNSLENAIEACEKLEHNNKRYIKITSQIVNSHLVFKIINSFNGKVTKNGKIIQSTKNEPFHGIGIANIKETVIRYKGNLDVKYTKHEFEVDIIMNINCIKYK